MLTSILELGRFLLNFDSLINEVCEQQLQSPEAAWKVSHYNMQTRSSSLEDTDEPYLSFFIFFQFVHPRVSCRVCPLFVVDPYISSSFVVNACRMNTWRRNDLLKISVEHLATCDCVGQIQVVWSDQENDPPGLEFFEEAARDKIRFEIHDTNSLSHRFNMTLPMETDGVFSTDDDLHISCADLKFGFESWQSSQKTMVGFTPRMVTLDPKTERFSYRSWRVVRWNGVYNVILTKCCFLHQEHLRTYMENMSEKVLAYIDQQRNCEDIAMSVVVAKYYKTPPLWVKGRVKEIGGDGISAKYDHFEARSACVDFFVEQFGGMPLIETSTKLYPMHSKLLSWL